MYLRSILEMDMTLSAHIHDIISTPSFTVEEVSVKSLNGGIQKKFTSLASTATSFKWDFGDTHTLDTTENPIYHTYTAKGTYTVGHQTCAYAGCCSGWCYKSISVQPPGHDHFLEMMGLAGFLFIVAGEKCEKGQVSVIVRGERRCVSKGELKHLEMDITSRA